MKYLIVLSLVLFINCAVKSKPTAENMAIQTPADRILAFQNPTNDSIPIVIIRDTGRVGGNCLLEIDVDDVRAALIAPGERAILNLHPGDTTLIIKPDPNGGKYCWDFRPVTDTFNIKLGSKFRLSSRKFRRPELELIQ